MGTLVAMTRECETCGGRIWRGLDGVWRHQRTGLHACPGGLGWAKPKMREARPDRGTLAGPRASR